MTRVLITGAGGQDGSYLRERLLASGAEVHAITHEQLDLRDQERVRSLVHDVSPDEIYNLAAVSSVARSWRDPELAAQVNGLGALSLMRAAAELPHEARTVQASSAELFGDPDSTPQDERTPIRPVNPYGAAKAFAHQMAGIFRSQGHHVSSVILYPHESPRRPPTFVTRRITTGVAAVAAGRADTLTLGNLDARRDWGWAPDYVEAMVLAARADSPDDYVVATGESHSVGEFAATAFARVGISDWRERVVVDAALHRPVDPPELVGDATKIRSRLGWACTRTFADVVTAMVEADLQAP